MADDDETPDEAAFDPTFASAGPRRSTFTPPPASVSEPPVTADSSATDHDDDALADALAADLGRIASGPVPTVDPHPSYPPVHEPTLPASEVPTYIPPAATPLPPDLSSPDAATPAWSTLPAPDPSQAVPLSEAPPTRRSMSDEELAAVIENASAQPGGTLDVIQQLEEQLRLRAEEAREFRAWETRTRPVTMVPAPAPAPAPETVPEPAADPEPIAEPEPIVEPPVAEPRPLPAWEVPAPSAQWAPDSGFDSSVRDFSSQPDYEAVIEPTIEPETGPIEAAAEPEPELELEVEPEPEPEPEPEAPPELIEPAPFLAPTISNPFSFEEALRSAPPPEPTAERSFAAAPETPVATPAQAFSFDDLLGGAESEEPPHNEPAPSSAAPEALFIEPLPVAAGEPIPTDTGSITVIDQAYEEELDDDVDETDRILAGFGPVSVDTEGTAFPANLVSPPSGPISTVRIPADETVLFDDEPVAQKVFSLEASGVEATPVDHRVGRSARLFWLWFATNSTVLSLGLGATVFAVGMSLRQSIVSVLAGVALSFIPLGLTTLAGKRSGQPTMVVSRATFGLIGNVVPALLALVTRLFWGAVLLWLLASSIAIVLVGAELDGALGERSLLLISLAAAFLIAVLVAFAGYPLFARLQLILSCISGVLVVGLIVLTARYIDIPQALTTPDGSWLLTITGAVLVFSFVGLVWAHSGADLARYQRPDSSGASSMLWATFGSTLPTFLLIGYGALLAASDAGIASGFLLSPLDTLALMLPVWYPIPLLAATALSLLSGVTLSLYSGGFALQSLGVRVKRQWSVVIVGVILGALAVVLTFGVAGGINDLFRDVATTLAVPTAAWAGIFAADTMIRSRRYENQSLVTRGGVYADVRWVNLVALFVITAVGWGLTTATIGWLSWQGYAFPLLGVPLDGDLASTDLGVLVALGVGLLVPIVTGIPAVRKQEAARV